MDMKPKELLAEIEREEREGNTTFSSLSAELRKKIENKTAGYYLAFYTAINPIFVEASRWVWQMHLLILFIPLLVFVFL